MNGFQNQMPAMYGAGPQMVSNQMRPVVHATHPHHHHGHHHYPYHHPHHHGYHGHHHYPHHHGHYGYQMQHRENITAAVPSQELSGANNHWPNQEMNNSTNFEENSDY